MGLNACRSAHFLFMATKLSQSGRIATFYSNQELPKIWPLVWVISQKYSIKLTRHVSLSIKCLKLKHITVIQHLLDFSGKL